MREPRRAVTGFWMGLACLVLGMGMLDRSFTKWRNDPRSLPYANGAYPSSADIDPALRSRFANQKLMKPMALSGVALVLVSVVLFGLYPLETHRARTRMEG